MATSQDHHRIAQSFDAVKAAGGLDGFAREVRAEFRTALRRRLAEHPLGVLPAESAYSFAQQEALDVVTEIITRRLTPDIDRHGREEGERRMINVKVSSVQEADQVGAAIADQVHADLGEVVGYITQYVMG